MSGLDAARRAFRDVPTVRVATVGPDGAPHVAPLWFVWQEDAIYVAARTSGRTWKNAERDPRVSLVLDRGRDWMDFSGVVLAGRAAPHAPEDPAIRAAMSAWHEKYRALLAGEGFERFAEEVPDLGFLRTEPEIVEGWDHAPSRFVERGGPA